MLGLLFLFFAIGLPVAIAFLVLNIVAISLWMGGFENIHLIILNGLPTIGSFNMVPIPLFILMGDILFRSGVLMHLIDNLGKWVGKVPGSLSYTAVASGTLFAALSGSSMSGVAVLGSSLVPEMKRRGYSTAMSTGPILGAGALAMIIPPSALAVLLASTAQMSVAKLLIAGIVPGLLLAGLYCVYIHVRCRIQPHLVPGTKGLPDVRWGEKMRALLNLTPFGFVIFLVTGVIFLGVATPTEASALGVMGSVLLTFLYRKGKISVFVNALNETLRVSAMVLFILLGSQCFSQILAYTGVARKLVEFVLSIETNPILIVIMMNLIVFILGCLMDAISICMITVPIFMPIVNALHLNPIWWGAMMVINYEIGTLTPPFGLCCFVMKGVDPETSITEIFRASFPFFMGGLLIIAIIMFFPRIALWLPSYMK
jgi:tripartite ATP-independent transporter DctM subunit